jgi:hypothetical protein
MIRQRHHLPSFATLRMKRDLLKEGPGFPWGGSLFQKTPRCANVFVFDTIMPDSQANLFGIPRNIDHRQNRPSMQYSLRSGAHVCQDCKDLEDLPDAHRTAELS